MYSRSESARLKEEFWIAFGRYMSLHQSSEGLRINWVNYHTGYKYVYFRMEAGQKMAAISIQLTQPDQLSRELYYDRFLGFRTLMENALGEKWEWKMEMEDEHGKLISKIYTRVSGVNVYDRNTWPEIISFLKPRILKLDEVWNEIKDAFEDLR